METPTKNWNLETREIAPKHKRIIGRLYSRSGIRGVENKLKFWDQNLGIMVKKKTIPDETKVKMLELNWLINTYRQDFPDCWTETPRR